MVKPSLVNGSNPLGCFYRCASVHFGIGSLQISPSLSYCHTPFLEFVFYCLYIFDASSIVSPILAFIKAHRLRGCTTNLKQAVAAHFDVSSLIDATSFCGCGDTLKQLGLITQDAVLTNRMLLKLHLQIFFLLSINWTKMTNFPLSIVKLSIC